MDWVVVTGAGSHDGRYPLDVEQAGLTTLEWGWIKRHAGYLPMTIADGYRGADPELFTALAVIAMHRAGAVSEADVPDVYAKLQRLSFENTVAMETDDAGQEDETDDPPTPTSSTSNGGSSGAGSPTSSEKSAVTPPVTGTLVSATSGSARPTSAA